MKALETEKKLCLTCMEEHQVQKVEVTEENQYKDKRVSYPAVYEYCPNAEEFVAEEEMIDANDISFKDAYRESEGLLTSEEIVSIRNKYGVSQKDLSTILGWGSSTIARYEKHQVQDRVHDEMLRKVGEDPKWFIELLESAGGGLD